ncbi:Alpha/Beta hydrolase protein [Aspergillus heterothallicus]
MIFPFASVLILIRLGQAAIISLPSSTGPCEVSLHASELVDTSQVDPYDPKGGNRSIMVTSFTPVNCGSVAFTTTYMPNATAKYEDETFQSFGLPPGTFQSLRIQTRTQARPPSSHDGNHPIVLFSPALGVSRLMYTLLLQEIASHGFAVVSVGHPYDADIVEYPDGRTVLGVLGNISTEAEWVSAMDVRVNDMIFLLDQLHDKHARNDIFPLSRANPALLSLDRATIFGHSLGGATAAQSMLLDTRLAGGINLDGQLWGPVVDQGLQAPFLLFGHANHTHATEPSWARFWSNSRGWKVELELAQSLHYTFSDVPVLLDAVSVEDEVKEIIQDGYTGTIGGLRGRNVVSAYIVAALRFFVYGSVEEIWSGGSEAYPEVSFVSCST